MENSTLILQSDLTEDSSRRLAHCLDENDLKVDPLDTKDLDRQVTYKSSSTDSSETKNDKTTPPIQYDPLTMSCDRAISFSFYQNDFHNYNKWNHQTVALNSQKYASCLQKQAYDYNSNPSPKNKSQLSMMNSFDKTKDVANMEASSKLFDMNQKNQPNQLNQPNETATYELDGNEFSVLHSKFFDINNSQFFQGLNQMINRKNAPTPSPAPAPAPASNANAKKNLHINVNGISSIPSGMPIQSQGEKMNFPINPMAMYNNMCMQMYITKMMMQNQWNMQNKNQFQPSQNAKDCNSQQQSKLNPISGGIELNMQNHTFSNKPMSFMNPYIPMRNQAQNAYFNHQSQTQAQVQPQSQPQTQAQAQAQSQVQTQAHPQVQPQAQPQVQPQVQPQAQPLVQTQAQTQVQPQPQTQINKTTSKSTNTTTTITTSTKPTNEESSKVISTSPSQSVDEDKLAKSKLIKGTIKMDKTRSYAFVSVKGLKNDIFICDKSLNQSINLDEVVVKLFPVSCWKMSINEKDTKMSVYCETKEEKKNNDDSTPTPPATSLNKTQMPYYNNAYIKRESNRIFKTREEMVTYFNSINHLRPEGQVVNIVKSPNMEKEHIACIETQNNQLYAYPINDTLPRIVIQMKKKGSEVSYKNKYYNIKIKGWDVTNQCPHGEIVNEIGTCGSIDVETEVLLHHYGVDYNNTFASSLLKEVHSKINSFTINEQFIKETGRTDLRNDVIFTVDPTYSKDLDDAISVKLINKEKGLLEIGVHIADPSYLVTKDSLLDKEAIKRVTTIYLVQKNIPMLPKIISDNYCSLLPHQDRLTITCTFRIFLDGRLDKSFQPKFELSVIQSKAKWNYSLVQRIINGETIDYKKLREEDGSKPKSIETFNQMIEAIHLLQKLTKVVREQRYKNGSLFIHNANINFQIDEKTALPVSYRSNRKSESHNLIEELMIIANKLCAEFIYTNMKEYSIIRRHPFLTDERFDEIKRYLVSNGIAIKADQADDFNNKINNLKQNEQQFLCVQYKLKNFLVKAEYVISGGYTPQTLNHSSLNFDLYTHFTSPIRRYSDMIVHRQLKDIIDFKNNKITPDKFTEHFACYNTLMDSFNQKYFVGKQISDKSSRLYKCVYLKNATRKEFKGLIVDILKTSKKQQPTASKGQSQEVNSFALSLYIPELHLEMEWNKEDNNNIVNATISTTNPNELTLEYTTAENKISNKVIKIFDSITLRLNVNNTGPLDVKCFLKLE